MYRMDFCYPDNETILKADRFFKNNRYFETCWSAGLPHRSFVVLDEVVWLVDMPLKRLFAAIASLRGANVTLHTTMLLFFLDFFKAWFWKAIISPLPRCLPFVFNLAHSMF